MSETNYIITKVFGAELLEKKPNSFLDKLRQKTRTIRIRRDEDGNVVESRMNHSTKQFLIYGGATFIILLHALGIYYYNKMWVLQFDVAAAESEVQTRLQERHDLSENLTKIVTGYAKHEEKIMVDVLASRGVPLNPESMPESMKKMGQMLLGEGFSAKTLPKDLVSKMLALAEQYPDLKLSQNFLKVTDAIVEIEKAITLARIKHINATNQFTTILTTFPSNLFGRLFGFKPNPFFKATDEAENFKPIDY